VRAADVATMRAPPRCRRLGSSISAANARLVLELRNHPFEGEPVGTRNAVFIGAGIAAVIATGISLTSARVAQ